MLNLKVPEPEATLSGATWLDCRLNALIPVSVR